MVPGDFMEFNSDQLEKKLVKNDSILAWRERKLDFEETPLREVAKIIKEHYGVDLILADDSVAGKTVSGMMPNDNLELLLQTLEATADFQIIRQGDKIIIKNQP
jgi:ferric-dicitrate binding protein FerR (iron transport regulator)